MFQYKCLNPISEVGLSIFDENYKEVEELQDADAVLVRSAAMHDMQDVPNLLAVARAGAGSIAEFARCRLIPILVPYPFSADNHQVENARFVEKSAAGICVLLFHKEPP